MKKLILLLFVFIFSFVYTQQPPIGYYSTPLPSTGQYFQGGIIGYIYNATNTTNCANIYDPCKYKGIILDTGNYAMAWGPVGPSVAGTQGCIGSGQNNTNTILSTLGNSVQSAAKYCDSIVINGYTDWFLPSNSEIHLSGISGITSVNWIWNAAYWSSSFYNGANPFSQWGFSTVQPGGSGVYFMNRASLNYVKPARYLEINLPYVINDSVVINSGDNINLSLQAYSQTGVPSFTWVAQSDNPNVCGETLISTNSALINDVLTNTTVNVQHVYYTVQAQSQTSSCMGDVKMVKVIILPTNVPFSAGMDTTICEGSSVALNASGANSYVWDNNIVNGQLIVPQSTTTYQATGSFGPNCFSVDSIVVTVLDVSENVIDQLAIDSFSLNGVTYSESGTFLQTLVSSNGCDSLLTLNLTLSFTSQLEHLKEVFSIFPNPATNKIHVKGIQDWYEVVSVEIINIYGKNIRTYMHPINAVLDCSGLSSGTYLLRLSTYSGSYTQQFLIE
jgi:hypothetical protein